MELAILACGAAVVRHKEHSFLFGAPTNVREHLDLHGIDVPKFCFTSTLKAPGFGKLGAGVVRFKEYPLRLGEFQAVPIQRKHGTDYAVEADGAKLLFSERGDVSSEDVEGYTLAIIKNKHRADSFGSNVITWPWPDAEYSLVGDTPQLLESFKVWSSMDDVPDNLKNLNGTPLTLEQANFIARVAEASGEGDKENWAIAIAQFRKTYTKRDGRWIKREKSMDEAKLAQDKVQYQLAGKDAGIKVCANCEYYCQDMTCCKVEGDINPAGVCVLWEYAEPHEEEHGEMEDEMAPVPYLEDYDPVTFAYMEIGKGGKNSKDRKASDHLIAEDDEKPSTWRLPVKTDGKPDHNLMGAASAALTVGYRGNKYEGPDKAKAAKKLLNMYESEGMKAPANLKKVVKEEQEKQNKKFGDVITAALHTAYNDTADYYFAEGFLNQEERMKVAGSVGPALTALREGLGELLERDVTGIPLPSQVKEILQNEVDHLPDILVDGQWVDVYKDSEGNWKWATISSVAVKDYQDETFTTKAMDWAIGFNNFLGKLGAMEDKGPFRYRHIPGIDGGRCLKQIRVGDFLFESGIFLDNPVGRSMRRKLKEEPEAWKVSLGLTFAKDDISKDGVYDRAVIFERSMTKSPANPITSTYLTVKEGNMKLLTEQELKAVAEELGMELTEVKTMYERAIAGGSPLGLKEFQEQLKTNTPTAGGANTTEYDEEDKETQKKALKEAIAELADDEWVDLMDVLYDAQQERGAVGGYEIADKEGNTEEEDEEEEMPMMGKGKKKMPMKKKEDATSDVVALLMEQNKMLMQQSKEMTALFAAMATGQQGDIAQAVAKQVGNMPRRQAAQFASGGSLPNALPNDADVQARLKAIEEVVKQQKPAGLSGIYDLFTSNQLNNRGGK